MKNFLLICNKSVMNSEIFVQFRRSRGCVTSPILWRLRASPRKRMFSVFISCLDRQNRFTDKNLLFIEFGLASCCRANSSKCLVQRWQWLIWTDRRIQWTVAFLSVNRFSWSRHEMKAESIVFLIVRESLLYSQCFMLKIATSCV